MGADCPGYRCRWVRGRLPLLTGGELTGGDRRKVERHLIACPGCRRHERSMAGALGVLRSAAVLSPVGPEAPSLWPALARQIREARHEPAPSWLAELARLVSPPARLRPALVTVSALALAVVTALGVQAWTRPRPEELFTSIGSVTFAADEEFELAPVPVAVVPPAPEARPDAPPLHPSTEPPAPPADRTASRFDYDLDHGTPMGPDMPDVKASY